jgi:hypothetical protein
VCVVRLIFLCLCVENVLQHLDGMSQVFVPWIKLKHGLASPSTLIWIRFVLRGVGARHTDTPVSGWRMHWCARSRCCCCVAGYRRKTTVRDDAWLLLRVKLGVAMEKSSKILKFTGTLTDQGTESQATIEPTGTSPRWCRFFWWLEQKIAYVRGLNLTCLE